MGHFYGATGELKQLLRTRAAPAPDALTEPTLREAMQHLAGAITALQFQDMASQLVDHTKAAAQLRRPPGARRHGRRRRRRAAVVEAAPLRPNPVTQDEMDAGSIELF
jgi:hypothetical protein